MTTYEQLLENLPSERRKRIEARAEQLIREAKARRSTSPRRPLAKGGKVAIAEGLAARLARLESRGDMSVNALRRQVAAMRGKLRVMVEIEGRAPIELGRLSTGVAPAE